MKKYIHMLFVLTVFSILLAGCGKNDEAKTSKAEEMKVYSFKGENGDLSINNGIIVISPTKELLYGGELMNGQIKLENIAECTREFFVLNDGVKETLFITSVTDDSREGMTIEETTQLGSISAEEDVFVRDTAKNLKDNFYFELRYTKTNGDKVSCQIQLDVTEVTKNGTT